MGQRDYTKALYEFNKQTYKDALKEFKAEQKEDVAPIDRSNNGQSAISTQPRQVEQRSGEAIAATAIVAFSLEWWKTVLPASVVTSMVTGSATEFIMKPQVFDRFNPKSNPLEPLSKEMLAVQQELLATAQKLEAGFNALQQKGQLGGVFK
jgi:hypothetical protein